MKDMKDMKGMKGMKVTKSSQAKKLMSSGARPDGLANITSDFEYYTKYRKPNIPDIKSTHKSPTSTPKKKSKTIKGVKVLKVTIKEEKRSYYPRVRKGEWLCSWNGRMKINIHPKYYRDSRSTAEAEVDIEGVKVLFPISPEAEDGIIRILQKDNPDLRYSMED